jgi:hypothetical protein
VEASAIATAATSASVRRPPRPPGLERATSQP